MLLISRLIRLSTLIGSPLTFCLLSFPAQAQSPLPSQHILHAATQPKAVSIPHLYWHFLLYQQHLDDVAAALTSQGKNGTVLRNSLQTELGFSDSDYASIHNSALHLSTEIKAIDSKAKAIVAKYSAAHTASLGSGAIDPADKQTLKDYVGEREGDINAEIAILNRTLSPANQEKLQAFLVKLFAPTNGSIRTNVKASPTSPGVMPASPEVR